jgi:hypothetical protein
VSVFIGINLHICLCILVHCVLEKKKEPCRRAGQLAHARPVAGPAHLERWHRASFWLGPPNFSTLTINKKVNNKFAGLPKAQNGSAISSPPVYVCLCDFLGLGLRCLAPDDRPSRTHVLHDPNSLYSPAERRRRLR